MYTFYAKPYEIKTEKENRAVQARVIRTSVVGVLKRTHKNVCADLAFVLVHGKPQWITHVGHRGRFGTVVER